MRSTPLGTFRTSVPRRRVEDGRARARPISERREVHVVAGAGADGAQQGAVHPAHDGAVELAWAAEALPVLVHGGHEDVLHLEIAAGMEERQRVDKALRGA